VRDNYKTGVAPDQAGVERVIAASAGVMLLWQDVAPAMRRAMTEH
jgi:hypothetical protein